MKKLLCVYCLVLLASVAFAQGKIIGNVVSSNGEPLPGANIEIEELDRVIESDSDGFFMIRNVEHGTYRIKASFIGYGSVEQSITVNGKTEVDLVLSQAVYSIEPIELLGTWAGAKTPMTYVNIQKEELEKNNLGQDVPFLLRWTPSTVVTSDAGTGIGYTGIRIRGTDPSRINVTINGISLNDSESQGVFWVDLPDFVTTTETIQIQRGVGTSTNGAGAFGATINLNTSKLHKEAYGRIASSVGSFNTLKGSVTFGSGLIADKFTFDGRLSSIQSDGYIDRGSSDLQSYYLSGAYIGKANSLRLNMFSGHEVTYQAWDGVPAQYVDDENLRTFNGVGARADGSYHDNEVDDYTQTHYQALYNHQINSNVNASIALHYTKGKGFFEQYKIGEDLAGYNLPDVLTGNDTIRSTDLIRRRWLDNDFYGFTYSLDMASKNQKLNTTIGGAWNNYIGKHFGEVIWARYMSNAEQEHRYYDNEGEKMDFNIFTKFNYELTEELSAYVDLQYRRVNYEFLGFDNDGTNVTQTDELNFFNPKAGLFYTLKNNSSLYASFAVANREPNRSDYTESTPSSRPVHETLYNTELGYNKKWSKAFIGANLYHMFYKNQLALSGRINDVGEATRINIDKSTRMGIEVQGGISITNALSLNANATLSQNKIAEFTEYIDNWFADEQETVIHSNTDLAFSPNIIVAGDLTYDVFVGTALADNHALSFSLLNKYVGKQYIDNTSNENTTLDAYFFNDFRIVYKVKTNFFKEVGLTFLVRNIFDAKFSTNAWTYRYKSEFYDATPDDPYARSEGESIYNLTGFYPQAGRNYLLGINIGF